MFMTHVRVWSVALIAAGLLGGSAPVDSDGSSAGGKIAAALANPDYVIQGRFNAIAPSTGNLYLTSNFYFRGSKTWEGDIFRTAKTNNNNWGQVATLYLERSPNFFYFGNITYSLGDNLWYGYFVANYDSFSPNNYSVIKRVRLDGGAPAVTIGPSPQSIDRESQLFSDGAYLYFIDANAVQAMPIRGSASNIVISSTPGVTSFGLDDSRVYFAAGRTIHQAPKPNSAGTAGVFATTDDPVERLAVSPGGSGGETIVFWSEGHVVKKKSTSGLPSTIGLALAPRRVFGLSSVGARGLWTTCEENSRDKCIVSYGTTILNAVKLDATPQAGAVFGDASRIYYQDFKGIRRTPY